MFRRRRFQFFRNECERMGHALVNSPILLVIWGILWCGSAAAQGGHGPVFGYATPTNSQGEWSFDAGLLGRSSSGGTQLTARSMIGYGFTPHLTSWITAPAILHGASLPATTMSGGDDFESKLAWRFHHNAKSVGTRLETTAAAAFVVPGPQPGGGIMGRLKRAPGADVTLVSGLASRSNYFWMGGGYRRFLERAGDRRPDVLSYSLVYGYRPASWRKEANSWDWRLFAEMTGERSGTMQVAGSELPNSQAHQIFLGPSALGIFHQYAVEAGVQLPVYQAVGPMFPKEHARFAVNFSYFLFQTHQH